MQPNLTPNATQLAYRARIRDAFFGTAYQQEVAWLDGPAEAAAAKRQRGAGTAAAAASRTKEN